jgi:hypothetical protein
MTNEKEHAPALALTRETAVPGLSPVGPGPLRAGALAWLKRGSLPTPAIPSALDRLRKSLLDQTVEQALASLQKRLDSIRLLALYEYYFPEEYRSSTASSTPSGESVYSERDLEFFNLVDQRLFPFNLDWLLEVAEEIDRPGVYIPVYALGIDWWNCPFDDLRRGWQLLLLLTGEVGGMSLWSDARYLEIAGAELRRAAEHAPHSSHLQRVCTQASSPLCFLPLALDALSHDTGNFFWDYDEENPADDIFFCREDMDALAREFREYQAMEQKIEALLDWIEADPSGHFKEVMDLWLSAS